MENIDAFFLAATGHLVAGLHVRKPIDQSTSLPFIVGVNGPDLH